MKKFTLILSLLACVYLPAEKWSQPYQTYSNTEPPFVTSSDTLNSFSDDSSSTICCADPCASSCWTRCTKGWEAAARIAAFHPESSRFRKIYDKWAAEYQLEVSKNIWKDAAAWVNVGYCFKRGRSIGLSNSTHIRLLPVSFGAKWTFCLKSWMKGYLGIGACYTSVKIKDNSPFVKRHISDNVWGIAFKSGVHCYITDNIFVDIFADYIHTKLNKPHTHRVVRKHSAQIGGLKIGFGLGYGF